MSEEEKRLAEWKKNQKSLSLKKTKEVQVPKELWRIDMSSEAGPVLKKVTAKNMTKVKNVVEDWWMEEGKLFEIRCPTMKVGKKTNKLMKCNHLCVKSSSWL